MLDCVAQRLELHIGHFMKLGHFFQYVTAKLNFQSEIFCLFVFCGQILCHCQDYSDTMALSLALL